MTAQVIVAAAEITAERASRNPPVESKKWSTWVLFFNEYKIHEVL